MVYFPIHRWMHSSCEDAVSATRLAELSVVLDFRVVVQQHLLRDCYLKMQMHLRRIRIRTRMLHCGVWLVVPILRHRCLCRGPGRIYTRGFSAHDLGP